MKHANYTKATTQRRAALFMRTRPCPGCDVLIIYQKDEAGRPVRMHPDGSTHTCGRPVKYFSPAEIAKLNKERLGV